MRFLLVSTVVIVTPSCVAAFMTASGATGSITAAVDVAVSTMRYM